MTFTSEMALIDSVNHGYSTDACLHHILNDISAANGSDVHFHFCSSVEATSPLKVVSFINFMIHVDF